MIDPLGVVELRWVRYSGGPREQGQVLGRPRKGEDCSKLVLQYRTDQTDWTDVPIVDAGK